MSSLFDTYQSRLERMVQLRLDRRLWGRIDAADVVQESFLDITRRLPEFLKSPNVPVYVWFRSMTEQALINVHRKHLGAQRRDARLEVNWGPGTSSMASSVSLAAYVVSDLTSPSQMMMRDEMLEELRASLEEMDPIDREVLALRHFEELTNNEVATILGLQKAAASNRYIRALKRLKSVLAKLPSFRSDP